MTNLTEMEIDALNQQIRQKAQLKESWCDFITEQRGNVFVTLTLNRGSMSLNSMKEILKKCLKRADKRLAGNRFYKKPACKRITGWFFAEKRKDNAHWHGLINGPENRKWIFTFANLKYEWEKLVKSGDADIVHQTHTPDRLTQYVNKEIDEPEFWEGVVMAEDFWPSSKMGRLCWHSA